MLETTLERFNLEKPIIDELKELEEAVKQLVTGPFNLVELAVVLHETGDVLARVDGMTKAKAKEIFDSLWQYYDDTYHVVDWLDGLIKLSTLLDDTLNIDGLAIRSAIKYLTPALINALPLPA